MTDAQALCQRLFIGCAGWSYPDWEGVVYPTMQPRGFSELAYLASYLDALEINTSFYRPPSPRMTARWVRQVEPNRRFLFTAKLWQRFTHERAEPWTQAEADAFSDGIRPLHEAGRLGALLMQFPWSFRADDSARDWLKRLAETFGGFPCVVEVRHASWDDEEVRDFLRQERLNFCNIDQPRIGASLGPTSVATGPIAYYRFHGRNASAWFAKDAGRDERYNYLYSESELAPWVRSIAEMLQQVERLFVMTNNHYRGQAVVNALQMKSQLVGRRVPVPDILAQHYPALESIATRAGQSELFHAQGRGQEKLM